MEIKEQIKLRLKGIDFPVVQIKSIQPFIESDDNKLKVSITPQVFIPQDSNNTFKIIINVVISGDDHFTMSVVGVGSFELSKEDITEDERNNFINANSIAIVFPYVRSFIANISSNLGSNITTPITLPVQFFHGKIELVDESPGVKSIH